MAAEKCRARRYSHYAAFRRSLEQCRRISLNNGGVVCHFADKESFFMTCCMLHSLVPHTNGCIINRVAFKQKQA